MYLQVSTMCISLLVLLNAAALVLVRCLLLKLVGMNNTKKLDFLSVERILKLLNNKILL